MPCRRAELHHAKPRASRFCRSSPRSSLSLARTAPCAPSRSRRWSSASLTSPAVVARCPSRAPSRRSPATSQSRLSAPTPTPSQRRSAARWSSTSGATLLPTRRPARPPIPVSGRRRHRHRCRYGHSGDGRRQEGRRFHHREPTGRVIIRSASYQTAKSPVEHTPGGDFFYAGRPNHHKGACPLCGGFWSVKPRVAPLCSGSGGDNVFTASRPNLARLTTMSLPLVIFHFPAL